MKKKHMTLKELDKFQLIIHIVLVFEGKISAMMLLSKSSCVCVKKNCPPGGVQPPVECGQVKKKNIEHTRRYMSLRCPDYRQRPARR